MLPLEQMITVGNSAGLFSAALAHSRNEIGTSVPHGDWHYIGDDAGLLILEAYRAYGKKGSNSVVISYLMGYNSQARLQATDEVTLEEIKKGICYLLPEATRFEAAEISEALSSI